MRSRTPITLPGRCSRCWVRERCCVCADLELVSNLTEVVILRHEVESQKSTGTARIAELILERVRVLPHTVSSSDLALPGDAWLLYPGATSVVPRVTPNVRRLIVLDGTWLQSRRMLKRMPELVALPWLSLPAKAQAPKRLRNAPNAESRSTLEAIADALGLIEGAKVADSLHRAHELYVARVLEARGVRVARDPTMTPDPSRSRD